MDEHDDDLETTPPGESGQSDAVAAALRIGLKEVAAAIERGLAQVAEAIGAASMRGPHQAARKQR